MILLCDKWAQIESGGMGTCGSTIIGISFLKEYKICGFKDKYSPWNWYKKLISRGCKYLVGSWIEMKMILFEYQLHNSYEAA